MSGRAPGLMVCGTTSNAGKTTIVAGLCRVLARRGLRVAPFKAQNMALNSAVTRSGHEIGRAQYLQAQAAGAEPEVAMNPILLKPTGEEWSQVVVEGRPLASMSTAAYHEAKPELFRLVMRSLEQLRRRYDVVLVEGAGSPAEINLLDHDIVNLRVAVEADLPAIIVGDIDLGGVFAALYGTVALLPDRQRQQVHGFIVNSFRGDPALLGPGLDQLEALSGLPTLGVVPYLPDLRLDAEDSVVLDVGSLPRRDGHLDVVVVHLPHVANFTDIDPLAAEPDVSVRFVRSAAEVGRPDLLVLPGSKATVLDLAWLRERGLADVVAKTEAVVIGICAGYQMLGRVIHDHLESGSGAVDGLGLLPIETRFGADKVLARIEGRAFGAAVEGYQIHHGRTSIDPTAGIEAQVWLQLGRNPDGVRRGRILGTTLHGLFDADHFRRSFLSWVAKDQGTSFAPSTKPFASGRDEALDRLADTIEEHVDLARIGSLIGLDRAGGQPGGTRP